MGYFPTHTRVDLHAIAAKAGSLFPEEVTNLALKSVKHLNVSPTKREEILETIVESVEPVIVVSALMNEVTQPIVTKAVNVYRTVTETGINQQPINARAPQKGNSLRANYNPYAGTSRSADIARGEAKKALKELATSKGYDINDPKVSEHIELMIAETDTEGHKEIRKNPSLNMPVKNGRAVSLLALLPLLLIL